MVRPPGRPRSPTLTHVRTLLVPGPIRPPGARLRPAAKRRNQAPPGELRYFLCRRRWFPTPAPAARDIVRPSGSLET
jgi:hypothetical protein